MGLIICPCCGRQRFKKPLKRKKYRCSNCGARIVRCVVAITTRMKLRGVEEVDIEGIPWEAARRIVYNGLLWIVWAKRYKKGWAAVKYRKLFGEWPLDDWKYDPPLAPGHGLNWFNEQQKGEYKKMMRRLEAERILNSPGFAPAQSDSMTDEDWRTRL